MSKYRKGYVKIFKVPKARKRMLSLGFLPPGKYPYSQQGDVMFCRPSQIPDEFDDEQAGWIARECYQCKRPALTKSNMECVRACLSFAFQLQTGKQNTPKFKANYKSVKDQFECQTEDGYAPKKQHCKVVHSVEPEGIKKAWQKEWTPACSLPYPVWNVGGLINFDWEVNGCRGGKKGGLMRIQTSREHEFIPSVGIMSTQMVGGRPKIPGINKIRAWKNYRVCLCPEGKHVPPPDDWCANLGAGHNPENPTWCTICPLNMFQCIQDLLPDNDKGRSYPRWLPAQRRYGDKDIGHQSLIPLARKWLDEQGANPDQLVFCKNSGRKALGKLAAHLGWKYSVSFPQHGDLWSTWHKYYQKNLRREEVFVDREQPTNVEDATVGLWKFARFVGKGRTTREDPVTFTNDQVGQLLIATLRGLGQGSLVAKILGS